MAKFMLFLIPIFMTMNHPSSRFIDSSIPSFAEHVAPRSMLYVSLLCQVAATDSSRGLRIDGALQFTGACLRGSRGDFDGDFDADFIHDRVFDRQACGETVDTRWFVSGVVDLPGWCFSLHHLTNMRKSMGLIVLNHNPKKRGNPGTQKKVGI